MRAIFFDLDGTLVDLPDDFEAVFEAALSEMGVGYDPHYYEFYSEAFFEYFEDCHPEPNRAAMADLCAEFDFVPDFDELTAAYVEQEVAATDRRSGARECLDALDAPLGVLTNGAGAVQTRKLEYHGLADDFEAVVVSGDAGAAKPDPEVFAAAKEELTADEYVFVADDLERDVLPAQEVGFTGVYLTDGDPADGAERADETVASLHEVPGVLGAE